jgi:hypothetical protein
MNQLVSSTITLTLYFTEHPECFDAFWRAHNTKALDSATFSPQLWEEIFTTTFGSPASGLEDKRWDDLFGKHKMMEALREFAAATAL